MRKIDLVIPMMLAVLLVAGACSKPAPTPTPAPAPTAKPSPTTAPAASGDPAYYPKVIANVKMPDTMILLGGGAADSGYTLFSKAYQNGLRKHFPNIGTRVELSTAAKSADRVNSNDAFLGITIPSAALDAWQGKPPVYKEPLKNIRAMALAPSDNALLPVVLRDSPIKDLSGLKGKRVFVGQAGSVTEIYVNYLLQAGYGYGYKEIEAAGGLVFRGSWSDGANQLLGGNLDIGFFFLTHPQADVLQIAASPKGMRIIDITDNALQKLWAEPWGETRGSVSAKAYPGMTKDFTATTTSAFMTVVNASAPDDVVYNVLVASYEDSGARLKEMHPQMAKLEWLKTAYIGKEFPIPYHPGAKKFWWDLWQKRGLLK